LGTSIASLPSGYILDSSGFISSSKIVDLFLFLFKPKKVAIGFILVLSLEGPPP
jgi:hypothetical protein